MVPQQIEDLGRNNDTPSSAVLEEVRNMLQEPLQNVHELDVNIEIVEKRLEELKLSRVEAQKQLIPYQSILSPIPIRRVPTDVLSEIFQHCLPSNRSPAIKTAECPILLTHICRKWRALALTDSRLWSGLYTTFSDDDMVPVDDGNIDHVLLQAGYIGAMSSTSKERVTQMLQTRIEAAQEWTSRAGTRPLSISLCFTTNFTYDTPHSNSDSAHNMTKRFELLASISARIEYLELKMPIKIYRVLEGMIAIPEMKVLKSFRADFFSQILNRQEGWDSPIAFLTAPNLRRVSMFGHENRIWGTEEFSHHWNKLTHMSVHTSSSIGEIATLLAHSPNLIHFQANIGENLDDINGTLPVVPFHFQGQILLPFLRTLHICDDADPSRTGNLYDSIDAPSLHWVTYLGRFRPYTYSADNLPPIPIIPLLCRSTGIRRLSIDALDNTMWGMGRIFRAVPNLTHLVIGRESRSPKGSLLRTAPVYIAPRLRQIPWDLGGLLINTDDPDRNIVTEDPLLPNLETLEICSHSGYFPDKKLEAFIISRLNIPSSQKTTNLKRVEVLFHREVEKLDVPEEVKQHAESVNAKIDLVFNYVKKLNEPPRSCAPSFGLHQPDGRSWCLGEFSESYDEDRD